MLSSWTLVHSIYEPGTSREDNSPTDLTRCHHYDTAEKGMYCCHPGHWSIYELGTSRGGNSPTDPTRCHHYDTAKKGMYCYHPGHWSVYEPGTGGRGNSPTDLSRCHHYDTAEKGTLLTNISLLPILEYLQNYSQTHRCCLYMYMYIRCYTTPLIRLCNVCIHEFTFKKKINKIEMELSLRHPFI